MQLNRVELADTFVSFGYTKFCAYIVRCEVTDSVVDALWNNHSVNCPVLLISLNSGTILPI